MIILYALDMPLLSGAFLRSAHLANIFRAFWVAKLAKDNQTTHLFSFGIIQKSSNACLSEYMRVRAENVGNA